MASLWYLGSLDSPVSLEGVQFARLHEELDAVVVSLGAGQVEGGSPVVVGGVHVGVGVPEPGEEKNRK